jgi:hypothetical protein
LRARLSSSNWCIVRRLSRLTRNCDVDEIVGGLILFLMAVIVLSYAAFLVAIHWGWYD